MKPNYFGISDFVTFQLQSDEIKRQIEKNGSLIVLWLEMILDLRIF